MNNFFCIFPNLKNYSGHEHSFTPSLNELAKKINYSIIYITPSNNIKELNNKEISLPDYKKRFINILFYIRLIIKNLNLFFKNRPISSNDILLIDGYSFLQLIIFSLFFYIHPNNLKKILVYYRIDISKNIIKKFLFKFCCSLFKRSCNEFNVLTDNKNLDTLFQKNFTYTSTVLPIPHILKNKRNIRKNNNNYNFSLWIPGPFRPDKGTLNTINIVNEVSKNHKFEIKINQGYKKFFSKKRQNVTFIQPNLNQKKYSEMLVNSDVILIPYDHKSYKYRTSGIFLEAISANKLTLVSANTWMADELKKNNLKVLIVKDWLNSNFLELIEKVFFDKKINQSLKNMQQKYLKIHGPKSFIKKMQKIISK